MDSIVVWGTGADALNFSLLCDDEIIAYIDNNKKEDSFMGISVFHPSESMDLIKDNFIVIATSIKVFWIIKKQLIDYGKKEFDDFCFFEIYKKKVAAIYGNCHTEPIREALRVNKSFSSEYGFYPLSMVQVIRNDNLKDDELTDEIFGHLSLFIHQDLRRDNSYGEEYSSYYLVKKIKACKVIAIPNVYGLPKFMFPQTVWGGEQEIFPHKNYFPFRDSVIEKLLYDNKKIGYISDYIKKGDPFKDVSIKAQYEEFIEKIKQREKTWDIKISDFLERETESNHCFYDANHPTHIIIEYIVNKVLKILCMEYAGNELYGVTALDGFEIPIYGQVMDSLGMKWENKYILRKSTKYTMRNKFITLDEYIEQYYRWNKRLITQR